MPEPSGRATSSRPPGPLPLVEQPSAVVGDGDLRRGRGRLAGEFLGLLEFRLRGVDGLEIITPHASHARGAQLSLLLAKDAQARYEAFKAAGLACDYRESGRGIAGEGIIRLAPAPLFNTFDEVWRAAEIVRNAMRA